MISVRYSDLTKGPLDILLCGIPVRLFISPSNPSNVVVRLSCVHKFEDSLDTDVEIITGWTYAFSYKEKEEELRVARRFHIVES